MKVHDIAAHEEKAQVLMVQGHTGYHRVFLIAQVQSPVFTNPGKEVIDPDAEAAIFTLHVVFLPDMRKIKVTDVVVLIETDEEFAVSNRYVSWHLCIPPDEWPGPAFHKSFRGAEISPHR
jgi:hypothetical protein